MFKIIWDEKAYEELNKLETIIARRIIKKVGELSTKPYSKDVKRLKGKTVFRLRVGDYRILFEIEKYKIYILKVGHRRNIYKK